MRKLSTKEIRKSIKNYVGSLPDREISTGMYIHTIGYKWVTIVSAWENESGYKISLEEFFEDMPDFWKSA